MSETAKIRPVITKYLQGKILDIGCGDDKVCPQAIGIDGRGSIGADIEVDGLVYVADRLVNLLPFNVVYSSHVLEHLRNDTEAIECWRELLDFNGLLILYLPDGRFYLNKENPEHMRDYNFADFMFYFKQAFCGEGKDYKGENLPKLFELVEYGEHIGDDEYSFYLVAKKQ